MSADWVVVVGLFAAIVGFLGGLIIFYSVKSWLLSRRFHREILDVCKSISGEGKPINEEWRAMVSKEIEILKEEKDHYQDGEDEIAETYDSADEAVDDLQRKCFP